MRSRAGSVAERAGGIEEGGKSDSIVKAGCCGEEGLHPGKRLEGNAGGKRHFELLRHAHADGPGRRENLGFQSLLHLAQAEPSAQQCRKQE